MTDNNNIFLEAANRIGARLCRDAVRVDGRCNWMGDSMEFVRNSWMVAHRSFGPDFYGGTAGIALFLSRLYQVTLEPLYRKTAEEAIQNTLARLEEISPSIRISFYAGYISIAYTLLELGENLGNEQWISKAFDLVKGLENEKLTPMGLDVINGVSGAIPVLIHLHNLYSHDFCMDLAMKFADHLLKTANKRKHGWSWKTMESMGPNPQEDLAGFSHGTSGIAWAFFELFQKTGDKRYKAAAEQAFAYEKQLYSPEHENWPDLRDFGMQSTDGKPPKNYSIAWCHGAPGIGLSRLRSYELFGKDAYRQEAEAAIRTTAASLNTMIMGGQGNYCLCHGSGGNADLLIYASQILKNEKYKEIAEQVGRRGIENHVQSDTPWPCGVMGGGENPSLMLGLTGIGYFYLRLYDPDKFPSLLILIPKNEKG